MKKNYVTIAAFAAMAASVVITSCGSSKQMASAPTVSPTDSRAPQNQQAGEVPLPFTGQQYKSDATAFRGKASGKSPDMATAKKIAMTNVKAEIAGNIRTVTKEVTDQYTKQRSVADAQELGIDFDNMIRTVTNEILANIDVMDEKVYRENDGKYAYWVVIEVSKNQVVNAMADKIPSAAKQQLDFDKFQYTKIFDAEMKEFAEKQQ